MIRAAILVVTGLAALVAWGPREPVSLEMAFDTALGPATVAAYLEATEAAHADIAGSARKRVVWAGAEGARTPLSVIYVHGFSATAEELRLVPDQVAAALGANLFFTRLAGHGRGSAAMAEPTVGDWLNDIAEALAVGRAIGDEVIVIATSTGGTLAALAAGRGALDRVRGVVLVSPNFAIKDPAAMVLTLPFARAWVPLVAGPTRSFAPQNDGHAAHWTISYPVDALFPMAAAVRASRDIAFETLSVPALFAFSPEDRVVDAAETRAVAARWGGPANIHEVAPAPGLDPFNHVLAGDILSPGGTAPLVTAILDWAGGL